MCILFFYTTINFSALENKLTITEEAINAECRSRDREEDGNRQREDETLIINSVYGLLRDVVSNRDDSNPGGFYTLIKV